MGDCARPGRAAVVPACRWATPPGRATPPGEATPPGKTTPPREATPPRKATPPKQATLPGEATPPRETTPPGNATLPGESTPPGKAGSPRVLACEDQAPRHTLRSPAAGRELHPSQRGQGCASAAETSQRSGKPHRSERHCVSVPDGDCVSAVSKEVQSGESRCMWRTPERLRWAIAVGARPLRAAGCARGHGSTGVTQPCACACLRKRSL